MNHYEGSQFNGAAGLLFAYFSFSSLEAPHHLSEIPISLTRLLLRARKFFILFYPPQDSFKESHPSPFSSKKTHDELIIDDSKEDGRWPYSILFHTSPTQTNIQNGQASVQCFSSTFHVLETIWCHAHSSFFDNNFVTVFIKNNMISIMSIKNICNIFDQSDITFSCDLTATQEFHNINEINYINETYKYTINNFNYINYLIDTQEHGSGEITLTQYLSKLDSCPNLLKQSIGWRLDHILDETVSYDTKNQWIEEIKEIVDTITTNKEPTTPPSDFNNGGS